MATQGGGNPSVSGLYTNANTLSGTPPGSLAQGDDVLVRTVGTLEPRRGFQYRASVAAQVGWDPSLQALTNFNGAQLAFTNDGQVLSYSSGTGGAALTQLGTYSNTSVYLGTVPTVTAKGTGNDSLLFTTTKGVYKLEKGSSNPRPAGVPSVNAYLSSSTTTGTGDWFSTNNAIAYRVVLARYDANNYLQLGTPSARVVITNQSGSSQTPTIAVPIPPGIDSTSGWFLQFFRSAMADQTYLAAPLDELYQTGEYLIQASDLTAGVATFTDHNTVVDSSAPLYTNANTGSTGLGIEASNDRPPMCRTMAAFRDFVFFGNTNFFQTLNVKMLGTGSPYGVQVGDVLTINGVNFTASAANSVIGATFKVETAGSATQNWELTARNLVSVINQYWNPFLAGQFQIANLPVPNYYSGISATYLDGDVPGNIQLQALYYDQAPFSFSASAHGNTAWSPLAGNGPVFSDNETQVAGLSWSNEGLPETAPLSNSTIVGDPLREILRLEPLGSSLFILKKNDGAWVLTGSDPTSFDIRSFDTTVNLVAPEAAAVLDNSIYAFTTKGVEVLTEAGRYPKPVSTPINRELLRLRAANPSFDSKVFAFAYESEKLFVLAVPASPTDSACGLQYVFNLETQAWTRWRIPGLTAAAVNTDSNTLFVGSGTNLVEERKALDSTDYQDTFSSGASPTAVPSVVRFNPFIGDSPFDEKRFQQVYFSFSVFEPATVTCTLDTDKGGPLTSVKAGPSGVPWGTVPWGQGAWGAKTKHFQVRMDGQQQTGSMLNIGFSCGAVGAFWQLQALEVLFEAVSPQVKR